jgi:small subunit ribosomal protein S4
MTMEKRSPTAERAERSQQQQKRPSRKLTEYGKQLQEKQKVKEMYGVREKQFRRFYGLATKSRQATGEALLSLLERRLDNVLYRLKLASTRVQARQLVVHGHVHVNGERVYSPSFLISVDDVVAIAPSSQEKTGLLEQVVDKRLAASSKAADWLELDKKSRSGKVLRLPVRADIQTPIEEYLIVELYSK